eukprot:5919032-Amphidinium_carterae.1
MTQLEKDLGEQLGELMSCWIQTQQIDASTKSIVMVLCWPCPISAKSALSLLLGSHFKVLWYDAVLDIVFDLLLNTSWAWVEVLYIVFN